MTNQMSDLPMQHPLSLQVVPGVEHPTEFRDIIRPSRDMTHREQQLWNNMALSWSELDATEQLGIYALLLRGELATTLHDVFTRASLYMWNREDYLSGHLNAERRAIIEMATATEVSAMHSDLIAYRALSAQKVGQALNHPIRPTAKKRPNFWRRLFGKTDEDE